MSYRIFTLWAKRLAEVFSPEICVAANADILGVFDPGSHGSTFGGNPLGCAVAAASLKVIRDEKLAERSDEAWQLLSS